jgi:hypothetical protein
MEEKLALPMQRAPGVEMINISCRSNTAVNLIRESLYTMSWKGQRNYEL